jgi:hypothetical protein
MDHARRTWAVNNSLRKAYFAERGLVTLLARFEPAWRDIVAPQQLALPWTTTRP